MAQVSAAPQSLDLHRRVKNASGAKFTSIPWWFQHTPDVFSQIALRVGSLWGIIFSAACRDNNSTERFSPKSDGDAP